MLFICLSVDEHMGCSYFLAMINYATVNICARGFIWTFDFIFLWYLPSSGILDHMVTLYLTFEQLLTCFPWQLYHFTFIPTMYEDLNFPTSCQYLFLCVFVLIAFLVSMKWCLIVLICIYLLTNNVEHFYMSICHLYVFFAESIFISKKLLPNSRSQRYIPVFF